MPHERVITVDIDPETLKKLLVSPEQFLDRIDQKRLAETSGAGQETAFGAVDHTVNIPCLIGIKIFPLYDFPERRIA
jgi:hypothetical protein